VLADAAHDLASFMGGLDQELLADLDATKEEVRLFLRRWCKRRLGRRPMVLPVVVAI